MELLWLGYDDLTVRYADVVAVLFYRPVLDARIARACGHVPPGVRAVVITNDGHVWPSRLRPDQIRRRWTQWRHRA